MKMCKRASRYAGMDDDDNDDEEKRRGKPQEEKRKRKVGMYVVSSCSYSGQAREREYTRYLTFLIPVSESSEWRIFLG
jgi:hypothetical protein